MQAVHETAGGGSNDVGHRQGKVYEEQGCRPAANTSLQRRKTVAGGLMLWTPVNSSN